MSRQVNLDEVEAQFSQLIDRAHAGEEIIVAKDGKPWARLVPLVTTVGRHPGLLKGLQIGEAFDGPLPDDELNAWERGR